MNSEEEEFEWLRRSNQKLDEASQRLIQFCGEVPKPLFAPVSQDLHLYRWTFLSETPLVRETLIVSFLKGLSDHFPLLKRTFNVVDDPFFLILESSVVIKGETNGDWPIIVLQAVWSDALMLLLDEMSDLIRDEKDLTSERLYLRCAPLLQKHRAALHQSQVEDSKKTSRVLEGILSDLELSRRFEQEYMRRAKALEREAKAILLQVKKDPAPTARALSLARELEQLQDQTIDLGWEAKLKVFSELAAPKIEELKRNVKRLS